MKSRGNGMPVADIVDLQIHARWAKIRDYQDYSRL